jgi:hypothetical protein
MVELVDTRDLKSRGPGRVRAGSSPAPGTKKGGSSKRLRYRLPGAFSNMLLLVSYSCGISCGSVGLPLPPLLPTSPISSLSRIYSGHRSSGRWRSRSLVFIKSCASIWNGARWCFLKTNRSSTIWGFRSMRLREFVSLVVRGRNCLLGFRTVSLDSFVVMPNHLHGIIHGRGAIYCAQFCAIHCVWFKRDWRCAFDLALHAYLWCAVSDFVILRSNAGFT